jgi:hypothetical protein
VFVFLWRVAKVPTHTVETNKKAAEVVSSRDIRFWPPSEEMLRKATTRAARAQQANSHVQDSGGHGVVSGALGAMSALVRNKFPSRWASSTQPITVLSACKDDQVAADACIDGVYSGATTWALVRVLEQDPHPRLDDLMVKLHVLMAHRGWKQEPQLALGKQPAASDHARWLMHWNGKSGGLLQVDVDQTLSREAGASANASATRGIEIGSQPLASRKSSIASSQSQVSCKALVEAVQHGNAKRWQNTTKAIHRFASLRGTETAAATTTKPSKVPAWSPNRDGRATLPDASPRVVPKPAVAASSSGRTNSWIMGQLNFARAKTGIGAKTWGHPSKTMPMPCTDSTSRTTEKSIVAHGRRAAAQASASVIVQRSLFPASLARGGRKQRSVAPSRKR